MKNSGRRKEEQTSCNPCSGCSCIQLGRIRREE
ncbi:hypothetical protein Pint_12000 [Pistacia integerrima]|uniref:Uncharacterized protein n=1 Tax=Pistacia integerrima TaxID=434235 RepID=A0ACC0XMU9_9ROSI|nr:hypothetical protein Pint_12000 [Pistacia integerrima]